MRFLLDQSADARLIVHITSFGHDALRVGKDFPHGIPDHEVPAIAVRERRILITNDRDFGELVFVHGQPHVGVIYLRLGNYQLPVAIAALNRVLAEREHELDQFLTVTPRGIRIRRRSSHQPDST